MKLQRYNLGELASHYASDKDNVVCRDYDVEKLEESHLEMFGLIKQFIDTCNTAPPMEVMQRIADLIEPMQNVLNKIEGTK